MKINPEIKLIIGLGNPGKEYEKTYHNAGFLAVDFLTENLPDFKFLKSDIFMNQSGDFVKKAIKKYKIKPEELMIAHDDGDIELGKCKISFNRGSAGHKGVESIIKSLKTKNFYRLRIGTRPKVFLRRNKRIKAGSFALKKISAENLKIFEGVFKEIAF